MNYIIYNPISGNKGNSSRLQNEQLLKNIPNTTILKTAYSNHASELTQQAISLNPTKIIVIGGDGTINEVAKELIDTEIPLGIVPMGSGNGLARHLGVPLEFKKALQFALDKNESKAIDVAYLNKQAFFCTAGIGFDATVAHDFSKRNGRGMINYVRSTFAMNREYQNIEVKFKNEKEFTPYFSITFANANQFGNHAYISPSSNLNDQLIELVSIKPLNFWERIQLGISLFLKTISNHSKVRINSVSTCELEVKNCSYYHLDGETFPMSDSSVKIKIIPKALRIIY